MEEIIEKDMTPILLEDLGMRYPTEKSKERRRYGLYQCQYCVKEFEAQTQCIKSKHTRSCGCQSDKFRNPHGLKNHRLYSVWVQMLSRCHSSKSKAYKNYGARGIKVCDRWMNINNFIEDMYPTFEEGLSLDRIDVNGNYEPDNCRWATSLTQMHNTRDIKSNNTSGYRGVYLCKDRNIWVAQIRVNYLRITLGRFQTALEAAKAYKTYVRLNNLEHNFTPALTEEEVEALYEKES